MKTFGIRNVSAREENKQPYLLIGASWIAIENNYPNVSFDARLHAKESRDRSATHRIRFCILRETEPDGSSCRVSDFRDPSVSQTATVFWSIPSSSIGNIPSAWKSTNEGMSGTCAAETTAGSSRGNLRA